MRLNAYPILRICTALLAVLLTCANALQAQPWWNDAWTGRLAATIDTTADGAPMTNSPGDVAVLIRLHGGNFPFGATSGDGSDIRVVADDHTTVLPHYLERFDDLLQEGFLWTRVPNVTANGRTRVWIYFGRTGTPERVERPAQVFADNAVLVYAFSGRGTTPLDLSGNNHHAATGAIVVEGSLIAGGQRLNGRQVIEIAATPALSMAAGAPFTAKLWVSPENLASDVVVFAAGDAQNNLELGLSGGIPFLEVTSNGNSQRIEAAETIAINTWRHLAVVSDGSNVTLFADGQPQSSMSASLPVLEGAMRLGGSFSGHNGFSGQVDQFQVHQVALPESVLRFAALNQGTGARSARMVQLSDEAAATRSALSEVGGYFAVIANSITTEGWVILWMLAFMSIFSWIIMILKLMYLNEKDRANRQFGKLWQHVSYDLAALDNDKAIETLGGDAQSEKIQIMRKATLFKLYHTGVDEIRHRLQGTDKGTKRLSGAAMQSIKASMERTYAIERKKLNSKIVYLTISISGGPFLGLLGTVVGVTITFAAIAAAGDVNINSIAPGVAAALTTTIAGLLVAIPALFGYNYLVLRIRDIVTEMQVFTGEFITKTTEFYAKKGQQGNKFDEEPQSEQGV